MSISQFQTYGLLDAWREYCLENIWHFNQLTGKGAYIQDCPVYVQMDRDVIARALNEAFQDMVNYLNYAPVPVWTYDDIPLGGGVPIQMQQITLSSGYVQAIGRRATTLIEAGATVTYSDVGGIGVDDTATITVTAATTIPTDEIRVFFQVADGANEAANEYYEIIPVTRSRSGTTVTLVAHRANFVKPNGLWSQPFDDPNYNTRNAGDNADATLFVTAVDVYRVYADDSAAVTLVGDKWLSGNGGCSTACDDDTCTACARLVDAQAGIIQVRDPNCTCCLYPERVRVYYRAGLPLVNNKIDPKLGIPLMRLTNTKLPRQDCYVCNPYYNVWGTDREVNEGLIPPRLINNPFGIMRGQIAAWEAVNRYALLTSGKLTRNNMYGLW